MVFKLIDLSSLKPFERYTFTLTDGKDGPNCNKKLERSKIIKKYQNGIDPFSAYN